MIGSVRYVALGEANLQEIADAVSADKEPRVLERDGKAVAALVSIEDFNRLLLAGPSPEGIQRALNAAGAWSDMDIDELSERVSRQRHESPPSSPITL